MAALLNVFLLAYTLLVSKIVCQDSSEQNWAKHNESVYFVLDMPKSWDDANQWCRQHGGLLAVIESEQEKTFVQQQLSTSTDVWLGCYANGTDNNFVCVSEENETKPMGQWANGQMDNAPGLNGRGCVVLKNGKLQVRNCNLHSGHKFPSTVCEQRCDIIARDHGSKSPCGMGRSGMHCMTLGENGRLAIGPK